jgi:microcystin-dependent protein
MSYLGTTDPDGWVICDGVTRTETDSRFKALVTLFGAPTTANSYTPPNLTSKFLYGRATKTTALISGGSSTATLTIANIPAHNHVININETAHRHTITDPGHTHGGQSGVTTITQSQANGLVSGSGNPDVVNAGTIAKSNTTGITQTEVATTGITATSENRGSGTSFEILPPYTTVNYIIKY